MLVRGTDRAAARNLIFRVTALVCVVAGAVGTAEVLWAFYPMVQDAAVFGWLPYLLLLGFFLCVPVTHLAGGLLMLLRGSIAAAVITALVTVVGTLFAGYTAAVLTDHPLSVARVSAGVVMIGMLFLSIFRLPSAGARR